MIVDGIELRHVTIYVTVKPSYSLQHDCHAYARFLMDIDGHSMKQEGDPHGAKIR